MNKDIICEGVKMLFKFPLIVGYPTYLFTIKKDMRDKKKKSRNLLLGKVYIPIVREINKGVIPGYGYEGLNISQLIEIIDIVEENFYYIDSKLEYFCEQFKEDLLYTSYEDGEYNFIYFDQDGEFLGYIQYKYNYKVYYCLNEKVIYLNKIEQDIKQQIKL